ncbi:hypothetical protein TRFO_37929 [Tritrichomonas foetus]|uniref:Uncharacterized protein n=1 Tax=Tritrichomonas foetus TaxID=1144522 RepID=A0A1J4J9V2_9EUKA|nr:hypothetical protein TRFO_37929 [Tritrichomonas foetus]|eukprot:OHS95936.1 hypothetical protein TRFO_37929 [Tritrichomonas foetus]
MTTTPRKTEGSSNSQQHFSLFLENILRSAEGLEQGRKNESFSSIELDQISNFFSRIAPSSEKSIDGCLLLAQQGIDSTKTEKLINSLNTTKNKSSDVKETDKSNSIHSIVRITNSIERYEETRLSDIGLDWEYKKSQKIQNNEEDEEVNSKKENFFDINFVNTSESIFPKEPHLRAQVSRDAITFANAMRTTINDAILYTPSDQNLNIFTPVIKIMRKWSHYYGENLGESTDRLSEFMNAFQYIFTHESDDQTVRIDFSEINIKEYLKIETYELLLNNALRFLQHNFRHAKYCEIFNRSPEEIHMIMDFKDDENSGNQTDEVGTNGTTAADLCAILDIDKLLRKEFSWQNVWDLIRSGLTSLITEDKVDRHKDNIKKLINAIKEPKTISPKDQKVNTDKLMTQCFEYAYLDQELKISDADLYDSMFSEIVNLKKFIISGDGLKEELLERLEKSQFDLKNNYDYDSVFDRIIFELLLLDFESCANELVQLCIKPPKDGENDDEILYDELPILVAHICLIFYNVGFYTKPYLRKIINDLVSFLPKQTMSDVALVYLALSRNMDYKDDIIEYLLSLDINIRINITSFQFISSKCINVYELVSELYKNDSENVNTIRILTTCGAFEEAVQCLNQVFVYLSLLPQKDIFILLESVSVLVNEIGDSSIELLEQSLDIGILSLCKADQVYLTERIEIIEKAEILFHSLTSISNSLASNSNSNKLRSNFNLCLSALFELINIAKVISAFEEGKGKEAIEIARKTEILPFTTDGFDRALQLLKQVNLQDSSSTVFALTNVATYLSIGIFTRDENRDELAILLKFSNFLDMSEESRSKLVEIRERVSIF